jgi:hypothetical protein
MLFYAREVILSTDGSMCSQALCNLQGLAGGRHGCCWAAAGLEGGEVAMD